MKNNLVSVLMPVYNVDRYIHDAVLSIQEQTYKNLEIIIIDDCSTDNTFSILESVAKMDTRIKLFKNSENLGITKTLNKAFEYATGDFIARMDGDDICESDRFEKKMEYLINNPDRALVGCSLISIDENSNKLGKLKYYDDYKLNLKILKYINPVSHIWIARREVYTQLNGYREIPGTEDYDFVLRAITNGFIIGNLENYYGYYVRISRAGNTINRLGFIQRKMHYYTYKLYVQRLKRGFDKYNKNDIIELSKSNSISKKIFGFSSHFLNKSIKNYNDKNIFLSIVYMFFSLFSKYQVKYLYYRLKYRIVLWRK